MKKSLKKRKNAIPFIPFTRRRIKGGRLAHNKREAAVVESGDADNRTNKEEVTDVKKVSKVAEGEIRAGFTAGIGSGT